MSGLGRSDDELSAHLRSRHAVGVELARGSAAVTEVRAAVVLGAGSASFEMLRSLVEVLPAMLAPSAPGADGQLVGGAGLRRGRRHPDEITVGEALDFRRVDAVEADVFRLKAEMKLPGEAWLEWVTTGLGAGTSQLVQRARFVPRGIAGRLYWWVLWPFHGSSSR